MRYDGTTLRDGEHDLIVYKVNAKTSSDSFEAALLCVCSVFDWLSSKKNCENNRFNILNDVKLMFEKHIFIKKTSKN